MKTDESYPPTNLSIWNRTCSAGQPIWSAGRRLVCSSSEMVPGGGNSFSAYIPSYHRLCRFVCVRVCVFATLCPRLRIRSCWLRSPYLTLPDTEFRRPTWPAGFRSHRAPGYSDSHWSWTGMVKETSLQCLSSRDLNWLSVVERTTEGGSAFQSLIVRTDRTFLLTLEVAFGFLNFSPWPLVMVDTAGSKNWSGWMLTPPDSIWKMVIISPLRLRWYREVSLRHRRRTWYVKWMNDVFTIVNKR